MDHVVKENRTAVAIKFFDHICDQVVDPNVSENGPAYNLGSLLGAVWSEKGPVGDLLGGLLELGAFEGGLGGSGGAPGWLLGALGMLRGVFWELLEVILDPLGSHLGPSLLTFSDQ